MDSPRVGAYYAAEQDVSFCIVTAVLVARLTRWQLVLEDSYRPEYDPSIWLARAAPQRWFRDGFNVTHAPTRFGRVSYRVSSDRGGVTYAVQVTRTSSVRWNLRWPGSTVEAVSIHGAKLIEVDGPVVSVTLHPSSMAFTVSAKPSPY